VLDKVPGEALLALLASLGDPPLVPGRLPHGFNAGVYRLVLEPVMVERDEGYEGIVPLYGLGRRDDPQKGL
jgi:hypothetical protein